MRIHVFDEASASFSIPCSLASISVYYLDYEARYPCFSRICTLVSIELHFHSAVEPIWYIIQLTDLEPIFVILHNILHNFRSNSPDKRSTSTSSIHSASVVVVLTGMFFAIVNVRNVRPNRHQALNIILKGLRWSYLLGFAPSTKPSTNLQMVMGSTMRMLMLLGLLLYLGRVEQYFVAAWRAVTSEWNRIVCLLACCTYQPTLW